VLGVIAGLGLALWASRAVKSLVWGVAPTDTTTFVAAAVVALIVATIASVIPALRIARVNPADTLRRV
jgi:ABC-type antimicrobial peptide transport system permease subunit